MKNNLTTQIRNPGDLFLIKRWNTLYKLGPDKIPIMSSMYPSVTLQKDTYVLYLDTITTDERYVNKIYVNYQRESHVRDCSFDQRLAKIVVKSVKYIVCLIGNQILGLDEKYVV